MKEFFQQIFSNPEVITAATSCIIAFFSMLTALFVTLKQRQSVKKAQAFAEKARDELALENAKLKNQILEIVKKGEQDAIVQEI